ncbi:PhoX family protein [Acinetobacter sp.]|uniref:PhoX family protein n=1 Tax=Acinetobacter sp. TaxID=472 RepID=UPI0028A8AC6B|nr:alkaline phosphatase PhoX [Acinetobacter sp.]
MTATSHQPTRRDLLKWFAGIPFLPLGAMTTAAALTGCNNSNDDSVVVTPPVVKPANLKAATFTAMAAPVAIADRAKTSVSSKLKIDWDDSSTSEYQLGYKSFFETGTKVPKWGGGEIIAGGYFNAKGEAIIDLSVPTTPRQYFSDCPDGSSLIHLADAKVDGVNNPVFHVVQFEYASQNLAGVSEYGNLPSPIAILTLDQNQTTGHLELKKYFNVDTAPVHGLWITCGASMSPWNTHLSSEEYEPDAFNQGIGGPSVAGMGKNFFGDVNAAKPYNYGHLPEVIVNKDGSGKIVKHFCLGRISHELVHVMPDNRTVIMGDDYTNGGFFMFIADKEKDLSAGTLYVAKYTSLLTENSTGSIKWIELGHATSKEIEDLVNVSNIQPTDIMESLTTNPNDASYTEIILAKKKLWVKVKPGMEKAAAFLETHRYAALKGGSMAFTKMEGTTVNIKDKVAYSALANIQDSMIQGNAAWVEAHNVSFSKKISAGGVLAHDLAASQSTVSGQPINSEWVPYQSKMLLIGEDITVDSLGNTANPDKIASPDNLKFSETLRTLFIGEDSGNHPNNFLWAYNVDSKANPVRLLSTPAGAESTGLHAVDSVNGWTYIMSNFQHAGDMSSLSADLKAATLANYNNGYSASVGYITADPIAPSVTKK